MRKLVDVFKEKLVFEDKVASVKILDSLDIESDFSELENGKVYGNFVIAAMLPNGTHVILGQYDDFKSCHEEFDRYLQSNPNEDFYFQEGEEEDVLYRLVEALANKSIEKTKDGEK